MERSNKFVSRHVRLATSEPSHTLSFVRGDSLDDDAFSDGRICTLPVDRVKSEKSVRFAEEDETVWNEEESLTDSSQTSQDLVTWVPSEHLYSDDTFIPETKTGNDGKESHSIIATDPTYGSSTFVELETDDETKTESICSNTESYASSDVFSSHDGSSHYKSLRDVTEIVKDIEELEESEFVSQLPFHEGEDTDAEDSFEEQLARLEFIEHSIQRLLENKITGTQTFSDESESVSTKIIVPLYKNDQIFSATEKKQAAKFCHWMMKAIQENKDENKTRTHKRSQKGIQIKVSPLYQEAENLKKKNILLENFGLSSTVVERLKMENIQHALHKKSKDLDAQIEKSETFCKQHQFIEEKIARSQFLSQTCANVLRENSDERIQAHLIKMHPVKCFAEFVKDLPSHSCDFNDVMYEYKRQVEKRLQRDDG